MLNVVVGSPICITACTQIFQKDQHLVMGTRTRVHWGVGGGGGVGGWMGGGRDVSFSDIFQYLR